jgi:protein SCO1/2
MTFIRHSSSCRLLLLLAPLLFTLAGCHTAAPSSENGDAGQSSGKRYHLTGRIVSADKTAKSITIDGDDIPGFMPAMIMPYPVKDVAILDKLASGDQITADIVVQNGDSWLENVVVTGHSAPAKPAAALHMPSPGDEVPDFGLTNQDGKHISLALYRGHVLLLTFTYTRCPFPDYCPRITHQFSEIHHDLQSNPGLFAKTHLLSITLDPRHDTPRVLRAYGLSPAGGINGFRSWEFATADDLPKMTNYFGLAYSQDGDVINHSLSTAVIGPDGKIFKWYHGNEWQPSDLLKDAADALHAGG